MKTKNEYEADLFRIDSTIEALNAQIKLLKEERKIAAAMPMELDGGALNSLIQDISGEPKLKSLRSFGDTPAKTSTAHGFYREHPEAGLALFHIFGGKEGLYLQRRQQDGCSLERRALEKGIQWARERAFGNK